MAQLTEIKPEELKNNPFQLIGKDWMLVTAKNGDRINTMTASWGGMGVMWNKNVAVTVLRPQRCTRKFIDATDRFSLSFYDESCRKDMTYVGRHSGNDDPDKIDKTDFTPAEIDGVPYFKEAKIVLVCKKMAKSKFDPSDFIDETITDAWYPQKDFHYIYYGAIEKVLISD